MTNLLPYRRIKLITYQTSQQIQDNIMRKRYLDDWRYFRYDFDEAHHQFEGLLQTVDWWFRRLGWVSVKIRGEVHDNLNMRLILLTFSPGPLLIAAFVIMALAGIVIVMADRGSIFLTYVLVTVINYLVLMYNFNKAKGGFLQHIREFTEARPAPFSRAQPEGKEKD